MLENSVHLSNKIYNIHPIQMLNDMGAIDTIYRRVLKREGKARSLNAI